MNIAVNKSNGITVVELPGRALDAGNARDFKAATLPLLEPGAKLVIDMSNLEFIDSTGLGTLVACLRQAHALRSEIKLCQLSKRVRALFELVRMHRLFEIFNTSDEAKRSYSVS